MTFFFFPQFKRNLMLQNSEHNDTDSVGSTARKPLVYQLSLPKSSQLSNVSQQQASASWLDKTTGDDEGESLPPHTDRLNKRRRIRGLHESRNNSVFTASCKNLQHSLSLSAPVCVPLSPCTPPQTNAPHKSV